MRHVFLNLLILTLLLPLAASAKPLSDTIKQVKPGIVAIGIFNPTASPRVRLVGTGFVVTPGNRIVTNYHVIAAPLDSNRQEQYVVLSGQGSQVVQHFIAVQAAHRERHQGQWVTAQRRHAAEVRYFPDLRTAGASPRGTPCTGRRRGRD